MAYETAFTSLKEEPRAATDLELAGALANLQEAAGLAGKAAEEFLTARDRWEYAKRRLDDMTAKTNALREQHDPPVTTPLQNSGTISVRY